MDVGKLLGKFLGNKSDRDMREVTPYVEKVREAYQGIEELSHDELRDKAVVYFNSDSARRCRTTVLRKHAGILPSSSNLRRSGSRSAFPQRNG